VVLNGNMSSWLYVISRGGRSILGPLLSQFLIFTCVSYAEARNRYRLDVCPSVRPSVTRWYCIKTAERIVIISSPHDSPFILVLCIYQDLCEIPTGSPPAGPLNRGGV